MCFQHMQKNNSVSNTLLLQNVASEGYSSDYITKCQSVLNNVDGISFKQSSSPFQECSNKIVKVCSFWSWAVSIQRVMY
jgi:hypothetical protein